MRRIWKQITGVLLSGLLAVFIAVLPVVAEAEANKDPIDLDGTYHAALGISTATKLWVNRNAYFSEDVNPSFGTENYNHLISEDEKTKETVVHEGEFTDVEIKGNGTYTVKLDGANFDGETTVCMFHVSTDIPVCNEIKFSNVVAKVNGKTIVEFPEPFMEEEEASLGGGQDIIIMNHWRDELKQILSDKGINESSSNGYDILSGAGNETVEVTFTVSGFHYDQEVQQTPEPTKTADGQGASTSQDSGSVSVSPTILGLIFLGGIVLVAIVTVIVAVAKRKRND